MDENFEISVVNSLDKNTPLIYTVNFMIENKNTRNSFFYKISLPMEIFVHKWTNIGDPQKVEDKIKLFLIREGFRRIKKELDEGLNENKEFTFNLNNTPDRFETHKECKYLQMEGDEIKCKISGEYTTPPKCEECEFPEYFAQCRYMVNLHPKIINASQGKLVYIEADCKYSGAHLKSYELKNCINKTCFKPIIIESSRSESLTSTSSENEIISRIREKIDNINNLMKKKHGFYLFTIHQQITWNILSSPCSSRKDFIVHINSLKNIIDWINQKGLGRILRNKPKEGTINYLEKFLEKYSKEKYPDFDSSLIITPLRKINALRKMFPTHIDSGEVIKAIEYFGMEFPVNNWGELWKKVILKFYKVLGLLEDILKK